jgi:hypothetical protein
MDRITTRKHKIVIKVHKTVNVVFFLLGEFPGVRTFCADVSEHSARSISIGRLDKKNKWNDIPKVF